MVSEQKHTKSPGIVGKTKRLFVSGRKQQRKNTPKSLDAIMDFELEDMDITDFPSQNEVLKTPPLNTPSTSTKTIPSTTMATKKIEPVKPPLINNIGPGDNLGNSTTKPKGGDEIERFISMSISKVSSTTNREAREKYIKSTNKQLDHLRQIQLLEAHVTNKTMPSGLKVNIRSTVNLPEELKDKWNTTIHSCSETLLQILLEHHQQEINIYQNERDKLKQELPEGELTTLNKTLIQEHNQNVATRENRKRSHDHFKTNNEHIHRKQPRFRQQQTPRFHQQQQQRLQQQQRSQQTPRFQQPQQQGQYPSKNLSNWNREKYR